MAATDGDRPSTARSKIGSLVRWIGTLGLGTYIVLKSDVGASWDLLSSANRSWVLLAVVLYAGDRFAAAGKWRLLLVAKGYLIPLRKAFTIYLASSFLGAVLPATVGADLIRARLAQVYATNFASSLSAVIVERLAGLVALGSAALIGLALFAPLEYRSITLTLGLWSLAGVAVAWIGYRLRGWVRPASRRGQSPFLGRIRDFGRELLKRLVDYRGYRGTLATVLGIAIGQQYLLTTINWILALALGMDVSLVTMLWVWPVVMLAIRVPVSVMGFGVREVLLIELMGTMGVPASAALTLGVASGLLDILFVMLGGGVLMIGRRGWSLSPSPPTGEESVGGSRVSR